MRSPVLAGAVGLGLALALALGAGACSDPAPTLIDASPTDPIVRCLIPADYGALGPRTGTQDATGTGTPSITVELDPTPPKDALFLSLVANQGVFAGGLKTGTFSITGADADFTTCGLCTNLLANIDPQRGPTKFYFATAGSVTLTSTNPVAGSAKDLHFIEIDLGAGGTVIAGGCSSAIASITFGT